MALYLEIMSGPLIGTRKTVLEGLVIGRKGGGLTIQDSKLSSKHAQVEKRSDGSFWLVDLGSSNGIKTQDDRVRALRLTPGLQFTLGRTPFIVGIDGSSATAAAEESAVRFAEAVPAAPPAPAPAPRPILRTFWDYLKHLAENAGREVKNIPRPVVGFSPPLRFKFTRGMQMGAEWTIGYGPRIVGTRSTDLTLEDQRLPEICFRLVPHGDAVLLRCEAPAHVRLNGRNVIAEVLHHGDLIDIATTQIQVHLDE